MTPLARAERFLEKRLQWLEGQLPLDGGMHTLWTEYVATTTALTRVREQLYGRGGAGGAVRVQAPPPRRPA